MAKQPHVADSQPPPERRKKIKLDDENLMPLNPLWDPPVSSNPTGSTTPMAPMHKVTPIGGVPLAAPPPPAPQITAALTSANLTNESHVDPRPIIPSVLPVITASLAASPMVPNPVDAAAAHAALVQSAFPMAQVPPPPPVPTSTPAPAPIKCTAAALEETMCTLGMATHNVFETWDAAEKVCLVSLSMEPLEETLQMEYYQKLVNLQGHEVHIQATLKVLPPALPNDATYKAAAKQTHRLEMQWQHTMELHAKSLAAVQDLETTASVLVAKQRYQRTLDRLEGLIMFELTKMNMSSTGYKLRKHIAKALQSQLKAVKTMLYKYNNATSVLEVPQEPLTWEQVVEYTFLADFDLLCEAQDDIRKEPWALPSGRIAMDQHYKLLHTDEEIQRLKIEILCFVTYMRDEECFLLYHKARIRGGKGKDSLAHQVCLYRMERVQFNAVHMVRLTKLSKEPGFCQRCF
ncbi:hypothetical protein B0H10DRAFT_2206396 [Mycena sp. CBHHK59/15]|nr:hypothetical protein B0H10DRAFT_2206396 [Mycena sp. CBHHK59/15]